MVMHMTFPQLTDRFRRRHSYLRIAVTERCNLRCRYCMPAAGNPHLPADHLLRFDEIERIVRVCARMGVTKIRLTGGEPLVRAGVPDLVRLLADIPGISTVGLTTNGVLLARYARQLREAGLRACNISLDSLDPARFASITRRTSLRQVLDGIDTALDAGFDRTKINTVVVRGINDDELPAFVDFVRTRAVTLRFIEYMPFADNAWTQDGFLSVDEMKCRLRERYMLHPVVKEDNAAVATEYALPGFEGRIGFIAPMSEHFCDACNRLRLTADGAVKSCLFSGDEMNLRDLLRGGADDAAVTAALLKALSGKWYEHPGAEELQTLQNRTMIRIGG